MIRRKEHMSVLPRRSEVALLALALALTGCASASGPSAPPSASSAPAGEGHGAVSGAEEVAEPPLQILSVDAHGAVGILDLLDGAATTLDPVGSPTALASDGRYAFVTTEEGAEVIDSGVWTWDHGDHYHYYRAEPRVIGTVPGSGPVVVATGPLSTAGTTGLFFGGSGEAVLLDNAALSRGEIVERLRIDAAAPGLLAPRADGAALVSGGEVRLLDEEGEETGAPAPCPDASGAITTRAGLVVGCADGALLLGESDAVERIPIPGGAPAPAALDGRKGRPTVAGVAPGAGYWLLDTRARAWELVRVDADLVRVVAVDDADGHVVALDAEGRVRVFVDGVEVAVTEPLVSGPAEAAALVVDAQRAYLNDPLGGVVHEIAYADGARVARTLEPAVAPALFTEVGR